MMVLLVVPDYGKWSAKLRHFMRSINGAVRQTLIFCSNNFNYCLVSCTRSTTGMMGVPLFWADAERKI